MSKVHLASAKQTLIITQSPKPFWSNVLYEGLASSQRLGNTPEPLVTLHNVLFVHYGAPVSTKKWCFFWNFGMVLL